MSSSPPQVNFTPGDDQLSNPSTPSHQLPCSSKDIPISPIRAISSPQPRVEIEIESCPSPIVNGGGGDVPFQVYEDKENAFDFDSDIELGEDAFLRPHYDKSKRFCSTPSPHRYHPAGNDGMRQHLLVQRTFNYHEVEGGGGRPLTSSPLRKIPFMVSPGGLTPSTSKYQIKESYTDGCNVNNNHGATPQFKTPVRGQYHNHPDRDQHTWERTPSAPRTPAGFMSPASSLYAFSTPGRQFVNPFETDERLHFPNMTPSFYQIKQKSEQPSAEKEGFWTVDQRAMLMPVEIKESEILRQHFYQSKRDREINPLLQEAANRFFANELIVPSPWSERKTMHSAGRLVQTPTGVKSLAVAKSVSCQTEMSVPPGVDLLAELGDKYRLPDDQLVHESPVDSSLAGCFIRRKLLHQLNENDSVVVGASPILPSRTHSLIEDPAADALPSPPKQVTPELEKQTPNKKSSGHFSSSPIRPSGDKGHYPAMSESDLLASPELSPIAGRGSNKPIRSSDMFTPRQEFERSREIMQLDFSSILDEPDEFDNGPMSEKTGTLIQTIDFFSNSLQQSHSSVAGDSNRVQDHQLQHAISTQSTHRVIGDGGGGIPKDNNSSADSTSNNKSFTNTLRRSLLGSMLAAEMSTQDIPPTSVPNLLTSQDTGYQTTSLQSITTLDSGSNPQSQLQDICSLSALSSSSSVNHNLVMMSTSMTNATNTNNAQSKMVPTSSSTSPSMNCSSSNPSNNANYNKDHNTLHLSFTNKYNGIMSHDNHSNSKADMFIGEEGNSLDSYLSSGNRLSYLFSDSDNNNDLDFYSNSFTKGHNNCRVRKIRTLADVRRSREKSSASRDLTSSFNEEAKSASTVIVRLSRSFSNPSFNTESAKSGKNTDVLMPTTAEMMNDEENGRKSTLDDSPLKRPDSSPGGQSFSQVNRDIRERTDHLSPDSINISGKVSLRVFSSSLEKRPFENLGIGAENRNESETIRVDDSNGVHSNNKFIKLLEEEGFSNRNNEDKETLCSSSVDFRPKFSLDSEGKNTLNEARELLGKAEALRRQHGDEEVKGQLEMDTFYQYISEQTHEEGCIGETASETTKHRGDQNDASDRKGEFSGVAQQMSLQPVRMSTPDDVMFDSLEEKIKSIEGVKLGSEIAAEILKRAGEDLAQFTVLKDSNSTHPNSASPTL